MKKFNFNLTWIIALLCFALFSFNFWLFYPGYLTHDWAFVMSAFSLSNHHAVMGIFLLKKITELFGYHLYYPILFNLVPFYFGVYFLVYGLWKKFHSKWCFLGFLPVVIGNIFFHNIIGHDSFASPMMLFLLWCVLLYQLLNGITVKNTLLAGIVFFLAVLSRHNALIQVYPVFFVYTWLIVQKLNSTHLLAKYIGIMFLFAFMTLAISLGIPRIIKKGESYPATSTFLHQIAGACVPNHDESCFKKDWYMEGKTYKDVEKEFLAYPLDADCMSRHWYPDHPFRHEQLDGLSKAWIRSIFKYPFDYLKHVNNFRKEMWYSRSLSYNISLNRKEHCISDTDHEMLLKKYPEVEISYESSTLKVKIYDFLRKRFPLIPTIVYILLNFILFGLTGFLFLKKKDILLLYSLSSTIAGISASIIFCVFSPVTVPRYIYPVLISTLMSVIGFIVYCSEKRRSKSINDHAGEKG